MSQRKKIQEGKHSQGMVAGCIDFSLPYGLSNFSARYKFIYPYLIIADLFQALAR
jgi:hypothetical protein